MNKSSYTNIARELAHAFVKEELEKLVEIHDFSYDLRFSARMTSTLGSCLYKNGKDRYGTLTFNENYLMQQWAEQELEPVINTIKHEVAHILVGRGHGHDAVWKLKMQELGGTPDRLGTSKRKDFVYKDKEKPTYTYVCPKCHTEYTGYHKKHYNMACKKCCNMYNKGKWSREFILELKED